MSDRAAMSDEFVAWFDGWWKGGKASCCYRRSRAACWAMWQELKKESEA